MTARRRGTGPGAADLAAVHIDDLRLPPPMRHLLAELIALLSLRDIEAYATGGFMRDALLGNDIHDLDISIRADPLELGPELADMFGGHDFLLDAERRLVRILMPDHDLHFDLLPLTGALEEDLMGRDYTVDAMAAPLHEVASGSVMLTDPAGGFDDMHTRTIRLVSEEALSKDALRLLRAVRLAVQLDFEIEPKTGEAIRRHAGLLAEVAAERQRDEVVQMLRTDRGAAALRLLDESELLDRVLPESAVMRDVDQPKEHHWNVLGHSFAAVEALDWMLGDDEPESEPTASLWRELWGQLEWWADAREYFTREFVPNTHRCSLLKVAGFLHDIGKPRTKTFEASGRMRFPQHAAAGAEIAAKAMRRLRFSSREVKLVATMVDAHLRPLQMAQAGEPTRRAVYRFFRDTGEAGIDTLFLSLADHLGTVGPRVTLEGWKRHVALISFIIQKRFERGEMIVEPPKLVDGDDIMEALGLPAGPLLGELLEEIREAHACGEIATREEAIALARRRLEGSATAAP
jgi:poly(A) polymerase